MMSVFPLSIFPNNITTVSCIDNRTYRLIQKPEPKDTERFLRHLTENIESGQTEHTESFLLSNPNIPNLSKANRSKHSYVPERTYRRFLTFETEHTEQIEYTDDFLRGKLNILNIFSFVGFARSSGLGIEKLRFCLNLTDLDLAQILLF